MYLLIAKSGKSRDWRTSAPGQLGITRYPLGGDLVAISYPGPPFQSRGYTQRVGWGGGKKQEENTFSKNVIADAVQ